MKKGNTSAWFKMGAQTENLGKKKGRGEGQEEEERDKRKGRAGEKGGKERK